jgi:hypothetical protein
MFSKQHETHFTTMENQKCAGIVDSLIKEKISENFRFPVNWKKLGLLNYPLLIKKPMDLSTLRKRLARNSKKPIKSLQEFFEKLQLIWDNCKFYNQDGSVRFYLF